MAVTGPRGRSDGRHELTAEMTNRGTSVAAMVRLSLVDTRSGDRVLPAEYDDNYLWLLPGESRTVTVSWPGSAAVARPGLRAEGYNVPEVTGRPYPGRS
ncbi:glycoside hydrolase family 2 protein [Streptomyces sp. LaPpAH-108]|uniref:glycoside hydrolase family 2 protein n=1 Tax=Streptomyces sp. LaPpAH-108 TaxID=1155714 RepID=UPI000361EEC1|nr:glycoside hydrolase family 2 protein [Streptomyces sp. LaPpAH-108]